QPVRWLGKKGASAATLAPSFSKWDGIIHVGRCARVRRGGAVAWHPADNSKDWSRYPADAIIAMVEAALLELHDRHLVGACPIHSVKMFQQIANRAPSRDGRCHVCKKLARFDGLQYQTHLVMPRIFWLAG